MMSLRAASRKQEALCSAARQYVTALRVEFSEGVVAPKKKEATALLDEWKGKKNATEGILKLLQAYKDLGDTKSEPLLKFHNPRTFEDLAAPVPNFRAQNLKPGEVGKFFDIVLQKRAGEAVDAKGKWWTQRKSEAEGAATSQAAALGTLPVPAWELGKPVSLDSLNKVTDAYLGSLEPARKVSIPAIPAGVKDSITSFMHSAGQDKSAGELIEVITKAVAEKAVVVENGKALPDFEFVSKAVAAKVLAARRAEVHARYVKMWAKKVLVSPELAAVPLKEVDGQLASKFEIDDAEEEELWMLTLSAQFRHIQKHFGVDLPHSVLAYMDPVLIKKIDWETTNGLEDWDITLEDMGAEVAKEQWGVENLSHHFLPLIRYRREKARKAAGRFEPELVAGRSA
ncbi:hypothetical protein TSOC_004580 [Tetrabaena socialis]|uniref:Uncharacterized protein n=1 Tax=Tetrabaena socialis TaxID=47790 RepID=A0A2J8A8J5_9CHLO|nr:hypothetical protein TSOC_004580 [Tetrabaena socialis]|eukprot:PNH08830.1 hypothetical protein TSOC_004580 [Tetrabaena socialis]